MKSPEKKERKKERGKNIGNALKYHEKDESIV